MSQPAPPKAPDILTLNDLAIRWQVRSHKTVNRIAAQLGIRSITGRLRPRFRLLDVLRAEEKQAGR